MDFERTSLARHGYAFAEQRCHRPRRVDRIEAVDTPLQRAMITGGLVAFALLALVALVTQ